MRQEDLNPGTLRDEIAQYYASIFTDPDYYFHPQFNFVHLKCSYKEYKNLRQRGELPATATIRRGRYSLSCFFKT